MGFGHFFVGNANKKQRRIKIKTSFWRDFVGVRSASDSLGVGCGIAAVDFPKLQSLNVNEAVTKTLVMKLWSYFLYIGDYMYNPHLLVGIFTMDHGSLLNNQDSMEGNKSICLWFKIPW